MIEADSKAIWNLPFFVPLPMISSRNHKYRELELEFEEWE